MHIRFHVEPEHYDRSEFGPLAVECGTVEVSGSSQRFVVICEPVARIDSGDPYHGQGPYAQIVVGINSGDWQAQDLADITYEWAILDGFIPEPDEAWRNLSQYRA